MSTIDGMPIKTLVDRPLADDLPVDFDATVNGPRVATWRSDATYTEMSPFTYADRIKSPILIIHGAADDNSGTFPIQSERMYAALKGMARPSATSSCRTSHTATALESTVETLCQMTDWLDCYVKPKPSASTSTTTVAIR